MIENIISLFDNSSSFNFDSCLLLLLLLKQDGESLKSKVLEMEEKFAGTKYLSELKEFVIEHYDNASEEKRSKLKNYEVYSRVVILINELDQKLFGHRERSKEMNFLISEYEYAIKGLRHLSMIARMKYKVGTHFHKLSNTDMVTINFYSRVREKVADDKRTFKHLGKAEKYLSTNDPKLFEDAEKLYFDSVMREYLKIEREL